MIKNVIFDMDGTILNTLDDLCDSVNYMLSECGYANVTLDEVRGFVGNGVKLLVKRALKCEVSESEFDRCMSVFSAHYDKNKENKTAPYDGILELMRDLKDMGIGMAVVSNKYDTAVKELTNRLFGEYIKVAIGESETVRPKPLADGVMLAMDLLGAKNYDTVYIGDSDVDYMTAFNSGIPFIGVTWGFREESLLTSLGTQYIARVPHDIVDILSARRYGLVGHNLKHTLSPLIHNELFALKGIKAEYSIYDVESLDNFRPIAEGLNVTIPHKINYINKLHSVDEHASKLGAVNCINNQLIGFNTDFYGFLRSFKSFYSENVGKILVLGYGGVGRVVVKALEGYDITVAIRNKEKIAEVANDSGAKVVDIASLSSSDDRYNVIVNTTPVGMYPNIDNLPIDESIILRAEYVYDLIYNPIETKFMKIAIDNGIKAKGGADMLVYQAVKAHEIWYGATFTDDEIDMVINKVIDALQQG